MLHLISVIKPQMIISDNTATSSIQEAVTMSEAQITLLTLEAVNQRLKKCPDVSDFQLAVIADPDNEVAILLCSSGSTGKQKAVEMVHSRVMYALTTVQWLPDKRPLDVVQYVAMNMSGPYWASCMILTLYSILRGIKLVLLQPFTADKFFDHVQRYKVNLAILGPDSLVSLAKHESASTCDLTSLLSVLYGGAPMSRSMLALAQKTLRKNVTVTYGLTESIGQLDAAYCVTHKPCNVGTLAANMAAKVIDISDNDKILGPNCEGELCFRNPGQFKRYRGNAQATSDVFDKDGFIHTGDVGYYDEDGFFFIVDRIKELIKYKRDHVPAVDIEEVLLQHPKVKEVAVIGVYHETDWEHATAVVVVKQGESVSEEELIKLVEGKLPKLKWLHGGVKLVTSLPRTASGKLQKQVLRSIYSQRPA